MTTGGVAVSGKVENRQKHLQHITKAVVLVEAHGSRSWGLKHCCQEGGWFALCSAGPGPLLAVFSWHLLTHPGSLKLTQSCSLWATDVVRGSVWKSVALKRGKGERGKGKEEGEGGKEKKRNRGFLEKKTHRN